MAIDVFTARITPDGSLAGWQRGPNLPVALRSHQAAIMAGRVWVWGGIGYHGPSQPNRQIFSAPLRGDGALGPWRLDMGDDCIERKRIPVLLYLDSAEHAIDELPHQGKRCSRTVYRSSVQERFQHRRIFPAGDGVDSCRKFRDG